MSARKQPAHVGGLVLTALACFLLAVIVWVMPNQNPLLVYLTIGFFVFTGLFAAAAAAYGKARPVEHGTDVELAGSHAAL